MKRTLSLTSLCVGLLVTLGACGGNEYQLIFAIDASFQGPHPDHDIAVAVVRTSDGAVLDEQLGTVAGTADPAFTFTWLDILDDDEAYEIHAWIDSHFGCGTPGVCAR